MFRLHLAQAFMPRPPNPTDHLDAVRHLMGTMPDQEVAALANSTTQVVGRYRRAHGIPSHRSSTLRPDASRPDSDEGSRETPERAGARRSRSSPLDAFRDQLGTVPDQVIAEQVGMTAQGVRQYRTRHNIPLEESLLPRRGRPRVRPHAEDADEGEMEEGQEADTSDSTARPVLRRKRRSKLDAYRDEVGKVPDTVLAKKAGVTVAAVRHYRQVHDIPLDPVADHRRSLSPEAVVQETPPTAPPTPEATEPVLLASTQDTPPTPINAASPSSPPSTPSPAFSTREIQLTRRQIERIEAYEGLIGDVHDREIAAMAEVSPSMVLQYRRMHNIPATWAPEKRHEFPTPKPQSPTAAVALPRAEAGTHAYAVRVRVGEQESEYALFATDLVAAARQAAAVLSSWPTAGTLVAVRYIGPALA